VENGPYAAWHERTVADRCSSAAIPTFAETKNRDGHDMTPQDVYLKLSQLTSETEIAKTPVHFSSTSFNPLEPTRAFPCRSTIQSPPARARSSQSHFYLTTCRACLRYSRGL